MPADQNFPKTTHSQHIFCTNCFPGPGAASVNNFPEIAAERDKYEDALFQPIPELHRVDGWKEVPLQESGEPVVPLGPFAEHNDIFTSAIYYGEHSNSPYMSPENKLDETLITMFVREEVAEQIRHAQQLLPEGHHLIVLDAYRSLEVQQALYDHYYEGLKKQHPDWTDDALSKETQNFVSLPSKVPSRPSPHNTGGSVDLAIYSLPPEVDAQVKQLDQELLELKTKAPKEFGPLEEARDPVLRQLYLTEMKKISLIRQYAEFLNFGTQFDHGGMESQLDYFEWLSKGRPLRKHEEESLAAGTLSQETAEFIRHGLGRPLTPEETEARDNRRMLYNAMAQAGLQAYSEEWWHYNSPKSQMGAKTAGLDHAEYGGVQLEDHNLAHEQMRRAHRNGLVKIHETALQGGHYLRGKIDPLTELILFNEEVLNETGDPRLTHLPKAAVIAPTETQAA